MVTFTALIRNFAEGGAGRIEVDAATACATPIRMVEHVERLSAELKIEAFLDRE